MKATELRIGNWFIANGKDWIATSINRKTVSGIHYTDFRGAYPESIELLQGGELKSFKYSNAERIPLTAQWLERFGWKPQKAYAEGIGFYEWHSWGTYETVNIGPGVVGIKNTHLDVTVSSARYVHQLQNLYFALTGEELTIKT